MQNKPLLSSRNNRSAVSRAHAGVGRLDALAILLHLVSVGLGYVANPSAAMSALKICEWSRKPSFRTDNHMACFPPPLSDSTAGIDIDWTALRSAMLAWLSAWAPAACETIAGLRVPVSWSL